MQTHVFFDADRTSPFPVVLVGGVLQANNKWDIAKEIINRIRREYPGAYPIRPKVRMPKQLLSYV